MLTNKTNIFDTLNENDIVRIQFRRDEGNNLPEGELDIRYSNSNKIDLKYIKKFSDHDKRNITNFYSTRMSILEKTNHLMKDKVSIYKLVSPEYNTDFINVVKEENGDYVLLDSGAEDDPVFYYNLSIKLIINKPEGLIKGSDFTGQMFKNKKGDLNSTVVTPLNVSSAKEVRENPDIYPPQTITALLELQFPEAVKRALKNHPNKGGKRRTKRRRSNKKRTNKRKKTKTRMKKRKTSKRKTNKRRRKR